MESATGELKKIFYSKNNYFIGLIHSPESPYSDFRGELKVKGNLLSPALGMVYTFHGEVETDTKWGDSLKFHEYEVNYPTDLEAIQSYLVENCRGIGPLTARNITSLFGENALEQCKNPDVLCTVKGITHKKALVISEALLKLQDRENMAIELKKILNGSRISKTAINRILERWEHQTVEKIRENPFDLTSFRGIGFTKADHVSRNVGFPVTHPFRIRAGLFHIIREAASGEGHCFLYRNNLIERSIELLTLEEGMIVTILDQQIERDKLTCHDFEVSLPSFYLKEREVSEKIRQMLDGEVTPPSGDFDLSKLAEDQQEALKKAICHQVFALTGAPGTGKTYTVQEIISAFQGVSFALCAPTGKSAARLSEMTSFQASTIHRLLKAQMRNGEFCFEHNQNNPLPFGLIVVDEASMIDINLFHSLVMALKDNTRLILVGDTNQLPPVGPGNVLRDLLRAGIPSVELRTIKRQDPGLIVQNCHKIKDGQPIEWTNAPSSDFFVSRKEEPEEIRAMILSLLSSGRLKSQFGEDLDIKKDVQVLSPVREKTDLSCKALNLAIQAVIPHIEKPEDPSQKFWQGDKVINLRNNYDKDIVNGDIGYIRAIEPKKLWVQFENPSREVLLPRYNNDLDLGYCLTVHKYQGSECPVVIIPIHRCFGPLIMQRNWIYTAVSRAKKGIVLIGQTSEFEKIIDRNRQVKRLTRLERMILNGD